MGEHNPDRKSNMCKDLEGMFITYFWNSTQSSFHKMNNIILCIRRDELGLFYKNEILMVLYNIQQRLDFF